MFKVSEITASEVECWSLQPLVYRALGSSEVACWFLPAPLYPAQALLRPVHPCASRDTSWSSRPEVQSPPRLAELRPALQGLCSS